MCFSLLQVQRKPVYASMDGWTGHMGERTAEEVCEQAVMTRIRSGEEGGAGVALLCPFRYVYASNHTHCLKIVRIPGGFGAAQKRQRL